MDVIGQHLDMLDTQWLTFGNLNLGQCKLFNARMTPKFVKHSKFLNNDFDLGDSTDA